MTRFDIHLIGVGGQGIGLLSETLLRAADRAGHTVKGVDTHGLAQRGGIVVSRIRLGRRVHSPLIPGNRADLVIALERHEAARGMVRALKDRGTLIYYDAVWQPLDVRLGKAAPMSRRWILDRASDRGIRVIRVLDEHLEDPRTQNIVVLAHLDALGLVPGIQTDHFRQAMDDLMAGTLLATNLALFERVRRTVEADPHPGGTHEGPPDQPGPDGGDPSAPAADPLPACRTSGAEHSRPDDMGGPCDDGRAG